MGRTTSFKTKACSHFICFTLHLYVLFKSIPKPPSALNWHVWHYVTWTYKIASMWSAALFVCIACTQLNLSLKQSLMKTCRSVQTRHEDHKYLVLQDVLHMHSYEHLHGNSWRAVSAFGCIRAAGLMWWEKTLVDVCKARPVYYISLVLSFISTVTVLDKAELCYSETFKYISLFQKKDNDYIIFMKHWRWKEMKHNSQNTAECS